MKDRVVAWKDCVIAYEMVDDTEGGILFHIWACEKTHKRARCVGMERRCSWWGSKGQGHVPTLLGRLITERRDSFLGVAEKDWPVIEANDHTATVTMPVRCGGAEVNEPRRIVQIAVGTFQHHSSSHVSAVYAALCNDGSVWSCARGDEWSQLPPIPQDS